jgi:tetratricopeptide (TPR) repeat protein
MLYYILYAPGIMMFIVCQGHSPWIFCDDQDNADRRIYMKGTAHICHTLPMFILFLVFMGWAAAFPNLGLAAETLEDAWRLDQKAERLIKTAQRRQQIDELQSDDSDKICDFALEYERAEWIKTKVYKTPFHEDVALTLRNIASLYKLCHAPMAQKYLQSVLKIEQQLYTAESEQAASAHDSLGDFQRLYMMEFKKAIGHYEQAKRIRIHIYGSMDPRITKNYDRLAITVFYHKNDKSYGEKLLKDSIAIREASRANKAFPSWQAHMEAGIYYSMIQAYDKAISHLETALKTFQDGRNNEDITILSELGNIYLNKNDLTMSLQYAKGAYDRGKILYKINQAPVFLQTIGQLADAYNAAGDPENADRLNMELKKTKAQLIKAL